jgi:hypothetical protein
MINPIPEADRPALVVVAIRLLETVESGWSYIVHGENGDEQRGYVLRASKGNVATVVATHADRLVNLGYAERV